MNLTAETFNYQIAPEETPPNMHAAAILKRPPLKDPPWNIWLRLARQGDEDAKMRFFTQAEPLIGMFCHIDYFVNLLGREEVRAIATLKATEFLMEYPDPPEDNEIPFLLKTIIRNALLYPTEKAVVRSRREKRVAAPQGDREDESGCADGMEMFPARRKEEPDAKLLEKELQLATEEAMGRLLPNEQAVLRSVFFQGKSVSAIAKELRCTRQNVEQMRNRGLLRLRPMLERQGLCGCA